VSALWVDEASQNQLVASAHYFAFFTSQQAALMGDGEETWCKQAAKTSNDRQNLGQRRPLISRA
ncbi:hypothetical protein PanWU01x14_265530, partial [Parasponia andersonii]